MTLISSLCLDFEKFSIEENPDPDLEYVDVGFHGEDALHHEEGFQEEEEFGEDITGVINGERDWLQEIFSSQDSDVNTPIMSCANDNIATVMMQNLV